MKASAGGETVGAVERGLLLGKVYAGWRGHNTDALATYDGLVKVRTILLLGMFALHALLQRLACFADPAKLSVGPVCHALSAMRRGRN